MDVEIQSGILMMKTKSCDNFCWERHVTHELSMNASPEIWRITLVSSFKKTGFDLIDFQSCESQHKTKGDHREVWEENARHIMI